MNNSWKIKAHIALYMQIISVNYRIYYFAIGSSLSLTFWKDILDQVYIVQLSSFSVISSWVTNWFTTNKSSFSFYGR